MILAFISAVYLVSTPALSRVINKDTDNTRICQLPAYPAHGRYAVEEDASADPNTYFQGTVLIRVTCDEGYTVDGNNSQILACDTEYDVLEIPQCVRYCALSPHISMEYRCLSPESNLSRPCHFMEFVGTNVIATCKEPHYHFSQKNMTCTEQGWDNFAKDCSARTARGTNITILARDKIEVFINSIEYNVPHIVDTQNVTKVDTNIDNNNNIDPLFWRFGEATPRPTVNSHNIKLSFNNNRNSAENVNISIDNGKVKFETGKTVVNVNK